MTRRREIPPTVMDELRRNLERLKLKAMLQNLDDALEEANASEQGYITFLAGLVLKEVLARSEAATARRLGAAKFPETKTFDTWDWTFQKNLNVQLVKDLMSLDFVAQGRPLLLLGRPGTGKTHLSLAYGHLAALRGYTVRFYKASRLLASCTPRWPTTPPNDSWLVWLGSTCWSSTTSATSRCARSTPRCSLTWSRHGI